jgi:hypothetical protein
MKPATTDEASLTLDAYPTPVRRGTSLTVRSSDARAMQVMIVNDKGQKVKQFILQGTTRVSTADMRPGIYYLRTDKAKITKKIMVIEN